MKHKFSFLPLAVSGLVALSACGSGAAQISGSAADGGQQAQQEQGQGGTGQGGFPGASGKIAAVQGKTLQVQGQQNQTAVTYDADTKVTQDVKVALSAVTVGSCVTVMPTQTSGSSAPSASADSGKVSAGTVRISTKQNGTCEGGFAVRAGQRPSGMPKRPSGAPSGMPSGGPGGARGRGGFGASGEVTAVNGSGFTVASVRRQPDADADGASAAPTTTPVSVTVSSTTTYTTTRTASAGALAVGRCVTAMGKSDDTGAVTAQTITVSDAVDGECSAGFAGFAGFGGRGGPGRQGGQSASGVGQDGVTS